MSANYISLWDSSGHHTHTHTHTHTQKSPAMVAPDVKAITDDFQVLGEGLVKSIDVQCDPPVVSGDTS